MKKNTWILIAFIIGIIGGGLLYRYSVQERDSRGATRLMRALEENDTQKTDQLLTVQEVNARDKSGQTPLFYAARNATQPQILYKLILTGADTFAKDKHGNTPLMAAAQYNPNPIITLVLAKQGGSSPQQLQNKNNALFLAAQYNTAVVIKTLLIAQANPAATDSAGHRAADYLATNALLSEQEKTDLRQVMLLLEILEEREKFEPADRARKPQLKQMAPSAEPKEEKIPQTGDK